MEGAIHVCFMLSQRESNEVFLFLYIEYEMGSAADSAHRLNAKFQIPYRPDHLRWIRSTASDNNIQETRGHFYQQQYLSSGLLPQTLASIGNFG